MLAQSDIIVQIFTGSTFTAMARIVDWSGNPLTVENTSSISLSIVFDPEDTAVPVTGFTDLAITPSGVMYDTLQTPVIWTDDDEGLNFAHTIDISTHDAFSEAGLYSVIYTIQPASGQVIIIRYAVTAN